MAASYSNVNEPGLLFQQYPPALLPKPGKENARLQKLLKKTEKKIKKKAAPEIAKTPVPFRSSLSPVNEASPDLEHSDHSTPPKTPEASFYTQHPRFSVRPVYRHVASPYPQQRGATFGGTARFAPQLYAAPAPTFPQYVAPLYTFTPTPPSAVPGPALHELAPKTPEQTSSVLDVTTTAATQIAPPVTASVPHPLSAPVALVTVTPAATQPTLRIAPVVIHRKSPSPRFKATEAALKAPKSMFDVPQIRVYTASMSPFHDYTGSKTSTADALSLSITPTSEITRAFTPTAEIKRSATPTSGVKRGLTPTPGLQRSATPTSGVKRGLTPTPGLQRSATPTSGVKRGLTPTPGLQRSATPTSGVKRGLTPTPGLQRSATPTSGVKRGLTPTPGLQRSATPTSGVKRAKTPTHDFLTPRTPLGRPKTPSFHVSRAKTPVFEISRTNPLLFAVSPITTEAQISNTPTPGTNAASQSLSDPSKSPSTILGARTLNGEVTSKETPTAKSPPQNNSKPEAPRHENPVVESARPKTPTNLLGYQRPKTPTGVAPTFGYQRPKTPTDITLKSAAPSYGYQRPKTPTIVTLKPTAPTDGYQRPKTPTKETSKPTAPSDGYPRPKTPTNEGHKPMTPTIEYQKPQPPAGYQRPKTPTAGVSSIGFQRPKTPTYEDPKPTHTYYGLTPAAYVAHGGIQSFSPLFGISRSKTPTQEESKTQELEASKTPTQELPVKSHPLPEVSNQEAPFKELEKYISSEAIVSTTVVKLPLPTIVVTQAEEVSETRVSTAVTSKISTPIAEMPKVKTVANTRPWAKSPTPEVKTPVKTPTYGVCPKPKTPTPETQRKTIPPFSKTESPVAKASVVQQKELKKSTEPKMPTKATSEAKPVGTKPTNSSPLAKTASPENLLLPAKPKNNQDAKPEKVVSAPTTSLTEKKEERKDSFPAAEPLLKVIQKPKGMMKSKLSGWSRLKKHMVVEEEPPMFTESDPKKETAKVTEQEGGEAKKDEKVSFKDMVAAVTADDPPKAAKKWDSLLFDMFSTKEKIMQVIEASKSEEERKEQPKDAGKEIPSFAHRLPVLLFSPKFDAKRLREAASRPLTKISTVFEMGLIGRKNKDEEPKDFNRTARGFTCP
ncbi:mucin-2 isoform X2 [Oncorhynchus keta]|uniref:mucin-2 isoform X2 n=1 Tax=Oncorhynchus keta TaxID=8018 RepID=UPI00227A4713|nr:mucin-2 isoform X2 [Oncorhynchus keta]